MPRAMAFDLSQDVPIDGYADLRLIAPSGQTSWLKGGLGKFRYGSNRGNVRFAEASRRSMRRLATICT